MTNKVSSFTTEKEQKRLTLSTRLALGASRFSDEVVEYLMQNEHQDEIQEILGAVVCLGKDQRFALLKAAEQGFLGSPLMNIPSEWAQAGEVVEDGIWYHNRLRWTQDSQTSQHHLTAHLLAYV